MAWTLTIMWLQNESNSYLLENVFIKCKEKPFSVVWNRASWMPPAAFLHPRYAPKSLAAGTLLQTPLWELTPLPRPPSWIKGATFQGRGKERSGREANKRKGEVTCGEGREFGPSQCWKQIDTPGRSHSHAATNRCVLSARRNCPRRSRSVCRRCTVKLLVSDWWHQRDKTWACLDDQALCWLSMIAAGVRGEHMVN